MEAKLVKEYEAMLPPVEKLEDIVAKGKVMDALVDAKLKLTDIKKADFAAWEKDPEKFVIKHNPKAYEELMAVGYHPQLRELMGVINIKLPYGYGGTCPKCFGSMEYVRFYVDWTNNGNFIDMGEDQGLGQVHVFDPGAANNRKLPLEYAVRKSVNLPDHILHYLESKCLVRRARAILSWVHAPPSRRPNWKPFWGNVFETNIRFHK